MNDTERLDWLNEDKQRLSDVRNCLINHEQFGIPMDVRQAIDHMASLPELKPIPTFDTLVATPEGLEPK